MVSSFAKKRRIEEAKKRRERKRHMCNRLRFYNPETEAVRHAPCELWSCPWCGPKLKAELRARLIIGLNTALKLDHGLVEIVLTLDPKVGGYAATEWNWTKQQAKYASACQRKLLKRWQQRRRRAGLPPLEYFWVNEWQKRGACHRHLVVTATDLRDLSRTKLALLRKGLRAIIPDAGFGQVCDIDVVRDPSGFGGYLAKYVTKAVDEGPLGCIHRYGNSKRFMPTRLVWKAARIARVGLTSLKKLTRFEGEYRWWCHPPAIEELARLLELRQGTAEQVPLDVWKFLEVTRPSARPGEEPIWYDLPVSVPA